jgi:hypothetical protein
MAAPDVNAEQVAVTALGGTQTGVEIHSVSSPFTLAFWYPKVLKTLQYITGSGNQPTVPKNIYKFITRKGVSCHADLPDQVMLVTTEISVPAGSDTIDAANVRGCLSAHLGAVAQQSAGIGDTAVSGIV